MIDITVAICTLNGAERLPEVLEALGQQQRIADDAWEILLVDNGSTDATQEVFSRFAARFPNLTCRYVFEGKPGQNFARRRAMSEARGTWLCFVDDDNVLEAHYLANALAFAARKPKLGAFGGRSLARLASPLPGWYEVLKTGLAIWDGGEQTRRLSVAERSFTAGLVARTAILRGSGRHV